LFRWRNYRNKGHNPENVMGSNPDEVGFCSSITKQDRRTETGPKLFVSARRLQELRS
jgi:hypothetical protein